MAKEKPMKVSKKTVHLSIDAENEDAELFLSEQEKRSLLSQRETFHVWADIVRGVPDSEKEECSYHYGDYCGKNIEKVKKVSAAYCIACIQAQKQHKQEKDQEEKCREEERLRADYDLHCAFNFFIRCGFSKKDFWWNHNRRWAVALECLDKKNAEIEELKKPIEGKLTEISNLKEGLQKLAPLENDNAFLKEQLEKLKHDPVFEKNVWLNQEVRQANGEIERLKAEILQKDAVIKSYMFQQVQTP